MIDLILNTATWQVTLARAIIFKAGGDVPVRVTLTADPGEEPAFELALSPQSSTPEVLAYIDTDEWTAESETVFTAVLDANDARLIAHIAGLSGATNLDLELAWTLSDSRRIAPNVTATCQRPVVDGPETSEGGPEYYTKSQGDGRYFRAGQLLSEIAEEDQAAARGNLGIAATVVFASTLPGIHLNSNVETGGGTDDTDVLQAALDALHSAGGGELVIDGAALITGLQHPSYVSIRGKGWNTGLFLADGSNAPCIRNANRVGGEDAIVDEHMSIADMTLNGNNANQDHDSTWEVGPDYTPDASDFAYLHNVCYLGFNDLRVTNIRSLNARAFGFMFSKYDGLRVEGCRAEWSNNDSLNNDGIHFWGPATNTYIRDFYAGGNDDGLAINPSEMMALSLDGLYVSNGIVSKFTVDGFEFAGNTKGVRLMGHSSLPINDVTLRNVYGAVDYQNSFLIYGGTDIGRLTIDGWSVRGTQNFNPGAEGPFTADTIILKDFVFIDHAATNPLISLNGNVASVSIIGGSISNSTEAGTFLDITGGTVDAINITGLCAKSLATLVANSGGVVTQLNVSGLTKSAVAALTSGSFDSLTGDAFASAAGVGNYISVAASTFVTLVVDTNVKVPFDSPVSDVGGAWNGDDLLWVVPSTGVYLISIRVAIESIADGTRMILSTKINGAEFSHTFADLAYGSTNGYGGLNGSSLVPLVANDEVEIQVYVTDDNTAATKTMVLGTVFSAIQLA